MIGCPWCITSRWCLCWHLFRRSRHWRIDDKWNESRRYTSWIEKVLFFLYTAIITSFPRWFSLCLNWFSFVSLLAKMCLQCFEVHWFKCVCFLFPFYPLNPGNMSVIFILSIRTADAVSSWRLYTQLEVLKNKTLRQDNPHISKRRGGRKPAHRRFSLQVIYWICFFVFLFYCSCAFWVRESS